MTGASPAQNWSSRRPMVLALAVFILSFALYALTLAPTVTLVDSGELILAARSLGVAHPPGFPLYVLLAHLATLVPMGNIAVRVNFASAIFAALAASTLTLAVVEAMATTGLAVQSPKNRKRSSDRRSRKRGGAQGQTRDEAVHSHWLVTIIPVLVAGLLLAFSRTLWAYATLAEVYTLNTFLIACIFFLMLRWRRLIETGGRLNETGLRGDAATPREDLELESSPHRPVAPSRGDAFLYAAALVFGLALGVHHVTVGLMLPAFAALVLATEGIGFFGSKRLLYAALFAFAGLFAVYAYLPIAASRNPVMNWGDTRTFERLWWHITGKQYQVFLSYSLRTAVNQFGDFVKLGAREFGPWWLPAAPALAIAGMVKLYKKNRAVFGFLALVIIADLA
jgi:Protein O-mannosyl-transferase TMEM260-like